MPIITDTKNLIDFTELETINDLYPFNLILKAAYKIDDFVETETSLFSKNWYLCLRQNLFGIQKELAMYELLNLFSMPTPVDIMVVFDKNKQDYYIATREIKNALRIGKLEQTIGYSIIPKNLAAISVLTNFFGEADIHGCQIVFQKQALDVVLAYKLDNAECFDLTSLKKTINIDDLLNNIWSFPEEYIQHPYYQEQLHKTIEMLVRTDFKVIEEVLRKNITIDIETRIQQGIQLIKKYFADKMENLSTEYGDITLLNAELKREYEAKKIALEREQEKELEVSKLESEKNNLETLEQIIENLRIRHEKLITDYQILQQQKRNNLQLKF